MDCTTATASTAATRSNSMDSLSLVLRLLTQGKMQDPAPVREQDDTDTHQGRPPTEMEKVGQLGSSTHATGHTTCDEVDASSYGLSPFGMPASSPAHQHSGVLKPLSSSTHTAMSETHAMAGPATTPNATATSPSIITSLNLDKAHQQQPFASEAACLQAQEWPASCAAAATSSTSMSAPDLLNADGPGTSSSPPFLGDQETHDIPTLTSTSADNIFDIDFSAFAPMTPFAEQAAPSANPAPAHPLMDEPRFDIFGADQPYNSSHRHGQDQGQGWDHGGHQNRQQDDSGLLTSWGMPRSTSSCSASSRRSGSKSTPPSSGEELCPTAADASNAATLSACKSSTHATHRGESKLRSDAHKKMSARICMLRGRSAINKRCMLENDDIDYEKLQRTREIARRSYWRRRNAEKREQEKLKVRLGLLDKTKGVLLAQKADLMAEREYWLNQFQARMQLCFF